MRPKICVLAGESRTHSVCMCTIYTPECEVDVIGSGGAKKFSYNKSQYTTKHFTA